MMKLVRFGLALWISTFNANAFAKPLLQLPEKFSELGLFIDLKNLNPAEGVLPYNVYFPLWSDGAAKSRWVFIPKDKKIDFDENLIWQLPEGSILAKQFDFDRRVETRVQLKTVDGWKMASYLWNTELTEATKVTSNAVVRVSTMENPEGFNWTVLAPNRCTTCHSNVEPLGFKTAQIGHEQIQLWSDQKLFSAPIPENKNRKFFPYAESKNPLDHYSIEELARSYLAVNCASCHHPDGFVPTDLDFSWSIENTQMNAVGVKPLFGNFNVPDANIIYPGQSEKSIVVIRMNKIGPGHMPFIGSTRVDQTGLDWIRKWIDSLNPSLILK